MCSKLSIYLFNDLYPPNHCRYFVDLDLAGLFDRCLPTIVKPTSQILQVTNPLQVTKYVERLFKLFEEHNIIQRLTKLKNSFRPDLYEKLDNDITTAMLDAEKHCYCPCKYPLPPDIHFIYLQSFILQTILSHLKGHNKFIPKIDKLNRKLLPEKRLTPPSTIQETYIMQKSLQRALSAYQRKYETKLQSQ